MGVCTDGAAAMLGKNVGFHAKVKSLNTEPITFTYSIIHREALASKKISAELCVVLQDAEKIINYIKSRALNSRLFSNLCKKMDSEFSSLLLHTEVRWLSRGKVLKRLIVLKDEVIQFLSESNSDLLKYFQDFFLFAIFILHSRESELYRYTLDGKSALAWELPFSRFMGHLSST